MANETKAPAAATPATKGETPNPENKVAKKRGPGSATFPTADAALKEAQSRETGHRRAFKITAKDGKETYMVSFNHHVAGYEAFVAAGGKVEELGRQARQKAVSVDSVLAALNSLPEEERKKVAEALKGTAKK